MRERDVSRMLEENAAIPQVEVKEPPGKEHMSSHSRKQEISFDLGFFSPALLQS
jgi:hypothetical protein